MRLMNSCLSQRHQYIYNKHQPKQQVTFNTISKYGKSYEYPVCSQVLPPPNSLSPSPYLGGLKEKGSKGSSVFLIISGLIGIEGSQDFFKKQLKTFFNQEICRFVMEVQVQFKNPFKLQIVCHFLQPRNRACELVAESQVKIGQKLRSKLKF